MFDVDKKVLTNLLYGHFTLFFDYRKYLVFNLNDKKTKDEKIQF